MPVQDFALDATGSQRVQVHWTTDNEPATVLLNGSALGSFTSPEERASGKDFALPDGSFVHVRFANSQPQAFRNGAPLPLAQAPVEPSAPRKRGGCLTAWLIVNLVLIVVFTAFAMLAALGAAVGGLVMSIPTWAIFAYALVGIIGIVGIIALLVWRKWGFFLVAAYVLLNIVLDFATGDVNVHTFTPLVAVAVLYYLLRQGGAWEHLK